MVGVFGDHQSNLPKVRIRSARISKRRRKINLSVCEDTRNKFSATTTTEIEVFKSKDRTCLS